MDETQADGLDIEARRRRLRFRAWHRGMREVDLLLGRFADATVPDMEAAELDAFETLLRLPDPDVLGWITGEFDVPPEADTPVLRRILAFHGTSATRPEQ